jgi:ferredoxin/flavodoxin---NADP+ reductase
MTQVGAADNPLRVAIIGAGPAGFYAAEALFKHKELAVEVDMFDKLPTPYGLVRAGVAPDHQKIKSVTKVFDKVADKPNFRFFGNVELGRDVHVEDLRHYYYQIVYTTGA